MTNGHGTTKELTGRTVFLFLLAFFAVVAAANGIMMRAAMSTFGGLETKSAYRVGLTFNREIAEAAAQDNRRWRADGRLRRLASGAVELVVQLRDDDGKAVSNVSFEARLDHPADRRRDRGIAMTEIAPGTFRGETDAARGVWNLVIDVSRNGERLFRSSSRIGPT